MWSVMGDCKLPCSQRNVHRNTVPGQEMGHLKGHGLDFYSILSPLLSILMQDSASVLPNRRQRPHIATRPTRIHLAYEYEYNVSPDEPEPTTYFTNIFDGVGSSRSHRWSDFDVLIQSLAKRFVRDFDKLNLLHKFLSMR